ncbi:MAG TPA: hypothetical protein VGR22_05600 [Thermomicrobiales bacterium]|nr:hypothetical protein [Thermomicrobiales bacterium]
MEYAIFTVSTPQFSPEVVVHRTKAAGYDGIEWRVKDDAPSDAPTFWSGNRATLPLTGLEENAPTWRRMAEDVGLEMPAIASYVKCDELERVELAMRGAAALGVPMLRIQLPT